MKKSLLMLSALVALQLAVAASAADDVGNPAQASTGTKLVGAAFALVPCVAGSGYAIFKLGRHLNEALRKNSKLYGNMILYIAFAEAISIYGLLVALLIMMS